ncbi:HEAT repeat domain-containing protein [Methanoregula formicica]|uniref:PBS lyase HEAT-like repeat protein n=1 Tax=Methanoregula formicica (strain DSM 22288 / NBRC 105244 / SMSP) TaxID=593750 RepID=L0HDT4_METFS|nr:HEAT repeat domain-containing protein [Methanoregula formicica]AGB01244.1 PBS lyase HEAT-like repeat protein [Methanoregula formicica SMSP]
MDGITERVVARTMDSRSVSAVRKFRQPLVEYLISGLDDNDKWVRVMAAEMLGTVGDPRSVRALQPLLAGWDSDLRLAAARSLARIRSPQSAAIPPALSCDHCMIRLVADEALTRLKLEQDSENSL